MDNTDKTYNTGDLIIFRFITINPLLYSFIAFGLDNHVGVIIVINNVPYLMEAKFNGTVVLTKWIPSRQDEYSHYKLIINKEKVKVDLINSDVYQQFLGKPYIDNGDIIKHLSYWMNLHWADDIYRDRFYCTTLILCIYEKWNLLLSINKLQYIRVHQFKDPNILQLNDAVLEFSPSTSNLRPDAIYRNNLWLIICWISHIVASPVMVTVQIINLFLVLVRFSIRL